MYGIEVKDVPAREIGNIRGGRAFVRILASGETGTPENFEMRYVELTDHHLTPRHHHNFDQVRWVLDGKWTIGKNKYVNAGEVCYFPEAAYYGGPSTCDIAALDLQFGSPSGHGVLTIAELEDGRERLLEAGGRFEDGVYKAPDSSEDKKNKDAYEAVWEHINGRPITFLDPPRFREPVVMNPASFIPVEIGQGVNERFLGIFSEGRTRLRLLASEGGGETEVGSDSQTTLLFQREGAVVLDDGSRYAGLAALHLMPGERTNITLDPGSKLLEITLPKVL